MRSALPERPEPWPERPGAARAGRAGAGCYGDRRRRRGCGRRWALTRPRGWRSARLSVPPDSATGANSHCTKTGAGVLLWPGGGRLAAEDAQDVPGAASCFLWEQNSRDYSAAGRRVDSGWAWCGLGAPLRPPRPGPERPASLGQPSLLLCPASFLPLWPLFGLANPEARWKLNVSPTPSLAPPGWQGSYLDTSFPTGWENKPRVPSGLILGRAL